jgi:hypothetical protein
MLSNILVACLRHHSARGRDVVGSSAAEVGVESMKPATAMESCATVLVNIPTSEDKLSVCWKSGLDGPCSLRNLAMYWKL